MDIKWFSKSMPGLASIYETNITLNTVASRHFKNAHTTLIGFDKRSNVLIIKAISRDQVAMGLYSADETHPISIKPSYGRINGKAIIRNISSFFPLDFTKKTFYKFLCEWDQKEKLLKVYLEREVS